MAAKQPNIILIVIDTLRADHLGCYGYHRDTSPQLDRLAQDGALFLEAYCAGIPTQPAHTSIFTGVHPLVHQIVCHKSLAEVQLSPQIRMLPQELVRNGYVTAAVDNLATKYLQTSWFLRGYDFYLSAGGEKVISRGVKSHAEKVNHLALEWIKSFGAQANDTGRPFFLFLHYWDPHAPYAPPPPYDRKFYPDDPQRGEQEGIEKLRTTAYGKYLMENWRSYVGVGPMNPTFADALYDGEVAYASFMVDRFLQTARKLGVLEDAVVVVTGDHGEDLWEGTHGRCFDHGDLCHCVVHIPLILVAPGRVPPGVKTTQMVQHTDIFPTLLELIGAPVPEELSGMSLLPVVAGKRGGHDEILIVTNGWLTKRKLRTSQWSLSQTLRPDRHGNTAGHLDLYRLDADPLEQNNLADTECAVADKLLARMETLTRSMLADRPDPLLTQTPS